MNNKISNKVKGAVEIIEEAFHVLRGNPLSHLSVYYIGSLPFIAALLFFWADMSRSAFARDYSSPAALGLALLFIWMKCWQAVFCQKITASLERLPPHSRPIKPIGRLIATQAFIQSTGLFVLPIAAITVIPFGWVYAFYQNLSSQDHTGSEGLKDVYNHSWRLAQLWPKQNHLLILIVSFFGLFVFFNIGMTIYLIPVLLNKLMGIETVFTLSGFNVFNTTFLITACALTYLCVDPLIKTIYTIRCFYGTSLETGRDIRADLTGFTGYRRGLSYIILMWLCAFPFLDAMADDTPHPLQTLNPSQMQSIAPQELDRSISETLEQREFAWRMPREREVETEKEMGLVGRFVDWLIIKTQNFFKWLGKWWDKILDWLKKLVPDREMGPLDKRSGWLENAQIILYIVLAILACLLAIILWRLYQRRKRVPIKIYSEPVVSVPDLTEDYIDPTEQPADQWLNMAKELMQKQYFRPALRAFYLSTLARLAENELIVIAKYKSNMDYVRELARRARDKTQLLSLFATNVSTFDRSWYGMHEVTRMDLDVFIENQERMMTVVQG